jgi:hypothetical protein
VIRGLGLCIVSLLRRFLVPGMSLLLFFLHGVGGLGKDGFQFPLFARTFGCSDNLVPHPRI